MKSNTPLYRSLVSSSLAMLICLSMLVGTTFAWFTDTASTSVNDIQAGILQVDIVDPEGASIVDAGLEFVSLDGKRGTEILWEPGATYFTTAFRIRSTGTLALRFQLLLTGLNANNKLLEALEFSVVDSQGNAIALDSFVGILDPNTPMTDLMYIKAHMKEDAGNEYQGLSLSGVGITAIAGQRGYEYDSSNNTYDANAPLTGTSSAVDFTTDAPVYHLSNAADLLAFAREVNENGNTFEGKTIKLSGDVDLAYIDWKPIGQTGKDQFMGTFDGCNYTIRHLKVDSTAEGSEHYASGLFGWINNAVIQNVKIDGAIIIGHHYSGAIVGYAESNTQCTITNCHVMNATVTGVHLDKPACGDKIGAVIGYAGNANTLVKDCTAADCTISGNRDVGQITGAALTANLVGCTATNVIVTENTTTSCDHLSAGQNIRNELIGRVTG